jgi:hypothetical protein
LLLDDRFSSAEINVRTGEPSTTTKLSLYTVTAGRTTREEVFYYTPAQGTVRTL